MRRRLRTESASASVLLITSILALCLASTLGVRSRSQRATTLVTTTGRKPGALQSPPVELDLELQRRGETIYPIMIEYRGNFAGFREQEFYESLLYASKGDIGLVERIQESTSVIIPDKAIIEDRLLDASSAPPLCIQVHGPLNLIRDAARRCALVRSVAVVWGSTPEEANQNYESIIAPSYNIRHEPHKDYLNNWRMNFRRYGRSKGWTNEEKVRLLGKFNPLLRSLKGNVDLKGAKHDLIYLEDWHDWHWEVTLKEQNRARSRRDKSNTGLERTVDTNTDVHTDIGDGDGDGDGEGDGDTYSPHRAILGEIIAEPIKVESTFCLADRPFLGTTTMAAIPAHLAAVAACVGTGDRVLDPFCGTGSLLLSCAYLGASVVGSDIDGTCLGLGVHGDDQSIEAATIITPKGGGVPTKFKNQNFQRKGHLSPQTNMSTIDNFAFYGLENHLEALLACDIQTWVDSPVNAEGAIRCQGKLQSLSYPSFDSIVCDPPYSKRERAAGASTPIISSAPDNNTNDNLLFGEGKDEDKVRDKADKQSDSHNHNHHHDTGSEDQDNPQAASSVLCSLFSLSRLIIKRNGRLVFWYPSKAFVTAEDVRRDLEMIHTSSMTIPIANVGAGAMETRDLVWRTATPEKLHDKMWRWLVVYDVK